MSVLAMTDKPQQKARILIIEDEAMIAFAIEQTLLAKRGSSSLRMRR